MKLNPARYDLVSIRMAVLCAELGSLSAAARQVHCSPSTGSYRLGLLEDAVGAMLFVRKPSGLRTTPAGELFVRHARAVLQQVELMNALVQAAEVCAACRTGTCVCA